MYTLRLNEYAESWFVFSWNSTRPVNRHKLTAFYPLYAPSTATYLIPILHLHMHRVASAHCPLAIYRVLMQLSLAFSRLCQTSRCCYLSCIHRLCLRFAFTIHICIMIASAAWTLISAGVRRPTPNFHASSLSITSRNCTFTPASVLGYSQAMPGRATDRASCNDGMMEWSKSVPVHIASTAPTKVSENRCRIRIIFNK